MMDEPLTPEEFTDKIENNKEDEKPDEVLVEFLSYLLIIWVMK